MYVKAVWPFASVVPTPIAPALGPAVTSKRTSTPLVTGETVAVTVWLVSTWFVSTLGDSARLVTPVDSHCLVATACGSPTSIASSSSTSTHPTMTFVPAPPLPV